MSDQRPWIGMVMLSVAVTFNAFKDGLAKLMVGTYEPLFILWLQMVVSTLILAPFMIARYGAGIMLPRPLFPQFLRGAFIITGVGCFYTAVQYIPLADSTAMIFIAPFIVTLLSPWVLGEKVEPRIWVAVAVGFAGVLLILRPEFDGSRLGYFIALGSGTGLGLFYTANRKLAGTAPPIVSTMYTVMCAAILLTPTAPFLWSPVEAKDTTIFLVFFVTTTIGQLLMVNAFRFGPGAIIVPFQYAQIIMATAFGWVVFQAFPDLWTWTGTVLIILTGIYIALREGRIGNASDKAAQE